MQNKGRVFKSGFLDSNFSNYFHSIKIIRKLFQPLTKISLLLIQKHLKIDSKSNFFIYRKSHS